jgi:hypothetical protein
MFRVESLKILAYLNSTSTQPQLNSNQNQPGGQTAELGSSFVCPNMLACNYLQIHQKRGRFLAAELSWVGVELGLS